MFSNFKNLRSYLRSTRKMCAQRPREFSLPALYRLYPRWKKSLAAGASPVSDEVPWINFAAIDFLRAVLQPKMRVFEFGSGGSTLFFSQRAGEVISVEHDPAWFKKLELIAQQRNLTNCRLNLIQPLASAASPAADPADPDAHVSGDEIFRGYSFLDYARSIDAQPEASLDLVLVDGRARPSCLKHALARTKIGGYIMVDNAERAHYQRSYELLPASDWKRRDFFGPGPYIHYFWQTNVWQRLR